MLNVAKNKMKFLRYGFIALSLFSIVVTMLYLPSRYHMKLGSALFDNFTAQSNLETAVANSATNTTPAKMVISAFRRLGFANASLMTTMNISRSLFDFTMTPWKILCEEEDGNSTVRPKWSMIVGVKSNSANGDRRKMIRESWASYDFFNGVKLKVFFVVGKANSPAAEMKLLKENGDYGDLLQIDKTERYRNVGLKALAAMQWVIGHSPDHWIYSSSDDDTVPNLLSFYKEIDSLMQRHSSNNTTKNLPIICSYRYIPNEGPIRNTKIRNFVSVQDYPDGLGYPPFCAGGFYSMPVELSNAIYRVSRRHKYFYNDDVWITGLLRLAAIDDGETHCDDTNDKYCAILKRNTGIARHLPNNELRSKYWENMENDWRKAKTSSTPPRNNTGTSISKET